MELHPGSVVWMDEQAIGTEQDGRRPALVISSRDHLEIVTNLVIVVPCTSRDRGWINHIRLTGKTGLKQATFAMTEQVRTIDRSRVSRESGHVDGETLGTVITWVHRWIWSDPAV